jgi:hypothetical protein
MHASRCACARALGIGPQSYADALSFSDPRRVAAVPHGSLKEMRLGTRDLEKDYNKTEDDLKALQVRSARRLALLCPELTPNCRARPFRRVSVKSLARC